MKSYHQKTSSIEVFSFPSTPSPDHQHNSDFEFGCITPDSPTLDPSKNSPADHIFSNGRLMPHSFPTPPPQHQQQQQQLTSILSATENAPRMTSRTSSVSSKDSLVSSRSNSTNSSRSSISSGRTSWSSSGDHQNNNNLENHKRLYKKVGAKAPTASKIVMAQIYGSSQRWQHIVPVSGLKRDDSRKSNNGKLAKDSSSSSVLDGKKQLGRGRREGGILWRFFRWFLVACGKCHSMESPNKIDMLE